jgi:small-conductance mechanosensitive channel
MTQRDRTELRRILNARFQLLHQQLHQRQNEVQNSIEKELRKAHEEAIKKAQKRTAALEKKVAKLHVEAKAIAAEMRELGIQPGSGRYSEEKLFTYTFNSDWSPIDLNRKINEAYKKVTEQAGLHKIDLRLKQLQLEEELAIGALGSDEARAFLERVPDIDKLLPMNGNVAKALESGEVIDA